LQLLQAYPNEKNSQQALQHASGKQVEVTLKSDDARGKISSGTRKLDGYEHDPRSHAFTRSEVNFSDFQLLDSESESQVECISARSTSCSTTSEATHVPPNRANCWYGSTRAKEICANDDFLFDEFFAGAYDGTNATISNLIKPNMVRSKKHGDTHSVELEIASNDDDLRGLSCNAFAGEDARQNVSLHSPMLPSIFQTDVQTGSVQLELSNKDDDLWAGFEDW